MAFSLAGPRILPCVIVVLPVGSTVISPSVAKAEQLQRCVGPDRRILARGRCRCRSTSHGNSASSSGRSAAQRSTSPIRIVAGVLSPYDRYLASSSAGLRRAISSWLAWPARASARLKDHSEHLLNMDLASASYAIEIIGAPYGIRRGKSEMPVKSEKLRRPAEAVDTTDLHHLATSDSGRRSTAPPTLCQQRCRDP